jgi:hypothetical protein
MTAPIEMAPAAGAADLDAVRAGIRGKGIQGRSLGQIAWMRLRRDKVAMAGGVAVHGPHHPRPDAVAPRARVRRWCPQTLLSRELLPDMIGPILVYAIFITILAFNLFGDGLRDALDPRSNKQVGRRSPDEQTQDGRAGRAGSFRCPRRRRVQRRRQ